MAASQIRAYPAPWHAALAAGPRLPFPEFEVDLDQDPEDRFTEVMRHFRAPLRSFLQHLHMEKPALKLLALELVRRRGPKNPELQVEIRNAAKIVGDTVLEIQALQWFYELNTIMEPIVNFSGFAPEIELEALAGAARGL